MSKVFFCISTFISGLVVLEISSLASLSFGSRNGRSQVTTEPSGMNVLVGPLAIMSKPVNQAAPATEFSRYSEVAKAQREESLRACREMTDAIYEGLDLEQEIRAVDAQGLGDTYIIDDWRQPAFCIARVVRASEDVFGDNGMNRVCRLSQRPWAPVTGEFRRQPG